VRRSGGDDSPFIAHATSRQLSTKHAQSRAEVMRPHTPTPSKYLGPGLIAKHVGGGEASCPTGDAIRHSSIVRRAHDVVQLVYASRPVGDLDHFDVQQIIATSRRHNWRAGVSGSLLFTGTGFVQVLEGRQDAVRRLFDRISIDKRHTKVRIVLQAPLARRAFPDWTMGCLFDAQLDADVEALLETPATSSLMVAKITNRMAADAFLGSG